jgi:hypothetical protein
MSDIYERPFTLLQEAKKRTADAETNLRNVLNNLMFARQEETLKCVLADLEHISRLLKELG